MKVQFADTRSYGIDRIFTMAPLQKMKVQFADTRLLVNDWQACFSFYKNVMEFNVDIANEAEGYAEFKAGNMKISLFRRQEMAEIIGTIHKPATVESQDAVALIFVVHDLDETYHELRHKGVTFTKEPISNPYYGLKTAYLRDPDGNLIGLFQPLL